MIRLTRQPSMHARWRAMESALVRPRRAVRLDMPRMALK
jgi:hypothetical protein